MANSINYQDKTLSIGDTITIDYKIQEGEKYRIQPFEGILIMIKGNSDQNRMITVRKKSHSGIGVERIFPLGSPFIEGIGVKKPSSYSKAKAYFIRNLSDQQLRRKLYKQK